MQTIGKIWIVLLSIALIAIGGCGRGPVPEASNTIAPKALTEDQQEIVDLLKTDTGHEIMIFSYDADAEYKDFAVWVEIYKDGECIDPHAGGLSMVDAEEGYHGELAVVITQDSDYQWSFIIREGPTKAYHTSEPNTNYDPTIGRAYGPMNVPAHIEDGKEILLYSCTFFEDSCRTFDLRELAENPGLLKEYPYAHIIKCKFTK